MLRTIPGYSHLKLLRPTAVVPPAPVTSTAAVDGTVRGCVQMALDVACGMRSPTALTRANSSHRTRIHIAAFRKGQGIAGPVLLQHIDVRSAPTPALEDPLGIPIERSVDVVGHYRVGGKILAFACRLDQPVGKRQWVMQSLRLF